MQFCTASMSAIMKLTKYGAIILTHTPCLVIANMADMEAVRNCITTLRKKLENLISTTCGHDYYIEKQPC